MPERRYLWTARVLVIICALNLSLVIILSSTIYLLLPQKGARPQILKENPSLNLFEDVEPLEKAIGVNELITESFIERYINLRHGIGKYTYELLSQWGQGSELYWLSSQETFQKFSSKSTPELVDKLADMKITRDVEFEWKKKLALNLWQVQFLLKTKSKKTEKVSVTRWRTYIRINYANVDVKNEQEMQFNPYGFKIINYSIAYLGNLDASPEYMDIAKKIVESKK